MGERYGLKGEGGIDIQIGIDFQRLHDKAWIWRRNKMTTAAKS